MVALLLLEMPRFRGLLDGKLRERPFFHAAPALADTAVQYFLISDEFHGQTTAELIIKREQLQVQGEQTW